MRIFAIGDLHLSSSINKPMNIFGDNWENHDKKIFDYWIDNVDDEDVVFVVGDISWATKIDDAKMDLDIIEKMPGKKIFIRGNHDYWWSTATALNKLYSNSDKMVFMNTNYIRLDKYAVCGTRGWKTPLDERFEEKDNSIYIREAKRLELSLEQAKKDGCEDFIVLLHYPPSNSNYDDTLFLDVIKKYKPKCVIYGHIHGEESFPFGINGKFDEVDYHLVSCDFLDFKLKEIFV